MARQLKCTQQNNIMKLFELQAVNKLSFLNYSGVVSCKTLCL